MTDARQMAKAGWGGRCARSRAATAALSAACCLLSITTLSTASAQEDPSIPREHHAWARFAPGSWKLVRIVTENYDPAGRVSAASVTETRTTLKEAGADGFTLLIESTVELDGKRIVSEPQQVTQRYNGAVAGQTAQCRLVGEEAVTINGQAYPCRVLQYEIGGAGHKTISRTYYSPETAPYVLRRETTAMESSGNVVSSRVLVEVKELNVPHMACGQTLQSARMRVQQRHAKRTETTDALSCVRVPGGVVSHDSTLVDSAGLKLSHTKLELVDFHAVDREEGPQHTSAVWQPSVSFCRAGPFQMVARGHCSIRSRFGRRGN